MSYFEWNIWFRARNWICRMRFSSEFMLCRKFNLYKSGLDDNLISYFEFEYMFWAQTWISRMRSTSDFMLSRKFSMYESD